jgi:hypothetical protein
MEQQQSREREQQQRGDQQQRDQQWDDTLRQQRSRAAADTAQGQAVPSTDDLTSLPFLSATKSLATDATTACSPPSV